MNNVDEFIEAQERLERKREEQWAAAIARQMEWDKPRHITGWGLLKFFGAVALGCAFVAFILFEPEIVSWLRGLW